MQRFRFSLAPGKLVWLLFWLLPVWTTPPGYNPGETAWVKEESGGIMVPLAARPSSGNRCRKAAPHLATVLLACYQSNPPPHVWLGSDTSIWWRDNALCVSVGTGPQPPPGSNPAPSLKSDRGGRCLGTLLHLASHLSAHFMTSLLWLRCLKCISSAGA